MTIYVALLRGVNVGGVRLAMTDLRRIAQGCGFTAPQTYIQSGNLVFRSSRRAADKIAADLRTALESDLGLGVTVVVRTNVELAAVVAANPFLKSGGNPDVQSVSFFAEDVDPNLFADVDLTRYAPEKVHIHKREVYFNLPFGTGRSPMLADVGRKKGLSVGTMRNWRTTKALLAMAEDPSAT